MFNKFAQWCDWVIISSTHMARVIGRGHAAGRHVSGSRLSKTHVSRSRSRARGPAGTCRRAVAIVAGSLLLQSMVAADVGLPRYHAPQKESQPESEGPVLQQISHREIPARFQPLDCHRNGLSAATTLDLAPPPDQRVSAWSPVPGGRGEGADLPEEYSAANISILLAGNRAVMRIGEVVTSVRAHTNRGATILTSGDRDYFSRLQAVRPVDTLLVENSHTIRRYRVKETRILSMGEKDKSQSAGDNLVLAACYPFQAIGTAALLYVVLAEPVPAPLTDSFHEHEGGSYKTVKF